MSQWDESKHPRKPKGDETGGEFAPKGYLALPHPGYSVNSAALDNEGDAEREFKRAIKTQYPNGLVLFHETTLDNLASIERHGLRDDQFATVGRDSNFINAPRKASVEIHLTPRQSMLVTPDMRYGAVSDSPNDNSFTNLLREHKGVYGADISLNQPIPRRQLIIRIKGD